MSDIRILAEREADGHLNDSINVGSHVLRMPLYLSAMKETDVEEWMDWHDTWEAMDKGTQDSYLVLLALKGGQ